jgi:hypothetical protein
MVRKIRICPKCGWPVIAMTWRKCPKCNTKLPKKNEPVICDGMTESMPIIDWGLIVVGLANIYIWSNIALIIYRNKKIIKNKLR